MTTVQTRPADADHSLSPVLWRVGGGLALAHVVLLFAGLSQEVTVEHSTPLATIAHTYATANMTRVLGGGYVEAMSFVVLTAAIVVVARLIGHNTEAGRLAAQTFLALGVTYVASTLAVAFAPGAAAMYAAHHHVDVGSIAMVSDIRNYAFVLQVAVSAAMALALGIAAIADGVLVKWVGWLGVALGIVGILATPFAHNILAMAWLVWWVGLGVLMLRGAPRSSRN